MRRSTSVVGVGVLASALVVLAIGTASGLSDPSVTRAVKDLAAIAMDTAAPAATPSTSKAPDNPGLSSTARTDSLPDGTYKVAQVVDGDTVKVSSNGKAYTLRLIGLDTPETVDPRRAVQCFGREASDRAKELLQGQTVRLESDPSQGDRDKYERLLRYVYLPDGQLYNKVMIADGYAHEYTFRVPYRYQADFKAAQATARAGARGLWNDATCAGDTTRPARQ